MENTKAKINVVGLSKHFGDNHVLNNLNFTIDKGEFVVVVGPTGCGKTTFLNLLTRIYTPSEGDLFIDGTPADPNKHNIAAVFQEPSSVPWLTVEDNIKFGLKVKQWPETKVNEHTDNVIKLLGLESFRHQYPRQLSVSCAQRVVIGRAFALYPDLLLMDEPYGQMDIKMRYYLEDEVLKMWKELGSTVVFITHNVEEAVYLAEKIIILTNKPTTIKEVVEVDLPRPRDFTSPEFVELRDYVTDQIKWW